MSNTKRKQLEKKVAAGHAARRELNKLDSAKEDKQNKKLIGTCWRYRNSYGSGETWWLYAKVIGTKDGWLQVWRFEKTSSNRIEIIPEDIMRGTTDYQAISEAEFNQAWLELMTELEALNK